MDPNLRRHIRNAALASSLGFLILAATFAYWQVEQSAWLLKQPDNRYYRVLERHIRRGSILDANGTPIAESTSGGPGGRYYPQGSLCAPFLGYLSERYGRTGLEHQFDPQLSGLGPTIDPLRPNPLLTGQRKSGDNLVLTIDLPTQKAAAAALGHRPGAVVAIEPATGRILALVSYPSFDPGHINQEWASLQHNPGHPLVDRALQSRYPPGSNFKVVTATAALDSGVDTPTDPFYCPGFVKIGGYTVHEMDGEVHGHLDLSQALAQSCNVTFAQVGLRVGAVRLKEYADRFWVDRPLDFVLPTTTGQITSAPADAAPGSPQALGSLRQKTVLAQAAFGQGQVAISPLEDTMIAAAVANGGVLMKPYLVDSITSPAGKMLFKTQPTVLSTVMKPETARELTTMMEMTFTQGTARHLQVPGLLMAGKTGTAQTRGSRTHAWFMAFAPADHPRVACACIVEHGGVGGVEAGPVVRATILAALRRR